MNLEFRLCDIITHRKMRMQRDIYTDTLFNQLGSVRASSALCDAKNYPNVTITGCTDHTLQQRSSLRAWQGLESSARETLTVKCNS